MAVKRGIVIDRYLASNAPDVYALGDCAEVEGLVLPFVMPIMHAARALARVMTAVLKDNTELFKQFMDNESFKRWLTDTVFGLTYEPSGKDTRASTRRSNRETQ